ncbi:MAG: peptidoglycan DD-metalloendopeptidase family protein [Candidatus Krumholzibacteriota bacterium]|nr:peptidoglycan DD-metalloendopeptidase family protein [Candidatus Krumholzibacteriota bacterium]
MKNRSAYLFFFLVIIAATAAPRAQESRLGEKINNKEKELAKLREEIRQQRKNIEQLKREEKNVGDYLEKLKEERSLTKSLLEGIEEKADMMEKQAHLLKISLDRNEEIYAQRLKLFSGRLREIYKERDRDFWRQILNADDFPDLIQRYKFFLIVAARDAAFIDDIKTKKEEISKKKAKLVRMIHKLYLSSEEKKRELAKLRENEEERKRALGQLKKKERKYERRIDELAAAEENLLNIITRLEKRKESIDTRGEFGEPDFEGLKGKMPMPVNGRTVREYGRSRNPEFGTVTFNSGLDIDAREGSPVRGVARGRVEYAGELSGYGNCIIINHGDSYYTLYARIARIFVKNGDRVEKGDIIAEVSSSTVSGGRVFHFEIRKSKKALNPGEWIE